MSEQYIPKMIQKLVLAALASWPFDPHKWPPISNREPFVRRLRLIKIPGASFSKTNFRIIFGIQPGYTMKKQVFIVGMMTIFALFQLQAQGPACLGSLGTQGLIGFQGPSSVNTVNGYNVLEDIKYEIENISSYIALAGNQEDNTIKLLELYNARGIRYFCIGLFENALDDFNYTLNFLEKQETAEPPMALALWGRMLCHAYQNHEEEAIHDLDLFSSYFLSECSPCIGHQTTSAGLAAGNPGSRKHGHEFQNETINFEELLPSFYVHIHDKNLNCNNYVRFVAEFADPNERLSTEECKQRVKGTADVMRLLTARIPNASLTAAVNFAISQLEDAMSNCCYKNRWTDCLGPIIDAYHYVKKCMDKGAAIAPKIIWLGR